MLDHPAQAGSGIGSSVIAQVEARDTLTISDLFFIGECLSYRRTYAAVIDDWATVESSLRKSIRIRSENADLRYMLADTLPHLQAELVDVLFMQGQPLKAAELACEVLGFVPVEPTLDAFGPKSTCATALMNHYVMAGDSAGARAMRATLADINRAQKRLYKSSTPKPVD